MEGIIFNQKQEMRKNLRKIINNYSKFFVCLKRKKCTLLMFPNLNHEKQILLLMIPNGEKDGIILQLKSYWVY